jgi:hypothetical protein
MAIPVPADAQRRREKMDERRRYPRVNIVAELHGRLVELDMTVAMRDISQGGFAVESSIEFPIGREHTFLFSFGETRKMTVVAVCRHCRSIEAENGRPSYLAGFEFLPQSFEQLLLILDMVARLVSDPTSRS